MKPHRGRFDQGDESAIYHNHVDELLTHMEEETAMLSGSALIESIYDYYEEHIRPYIEYYDAVQERTVSKPKWDKYIIYQHLTQHTSNGSSFQDRRVVETLYACMEKLQSTLVVDDERQVMCSESLALYLKVAGTYIRFKQHTEKK